MPATSVLLVPGTHGWGYTKGQQWWDYGSPFTTFLETADCCILGKAFPYLWSTSLDGVWFFHRTTKRHIQWESAGYSLYSYLANKLAPGDYVPIADRNLIAHSHAMQVVAYACAQGLKINRLLTMGSPVRNDMQEIYAQARPNIGQWLHVHSDRSDRIQWFGELFDGKLGIVRKQPFANVNLGIPAVAHSNLLTDPECFPLWAADGLLDFLRKGATDAARP